MSNIHLYGVAIFNLADVFGTDLCMMCAPVGLSIFDGSVIFICLKLVKFGCWYSSYTSCRKVKDETQS